MPKTLSGKSFPALSLSSGECGDQA